MKHVVLGIASLLLASCATVPAGTPAPVKAQANFDLACKYANGTLDAARPALPLIEGLILAKLGQDPSTAFAAAIQLITTTCSAPLNIADSAAVIQRVYDAGGQIVALVVKSQQATK